MKTWLYTKIKRSNNTSGVKLYEEPDGGNNFVLGENSSLQKMPGQHHQRSPVEVPQAIGNKLTPFQREKTKLERMDLLELHRAKDISQSTENKPA